MKYFLLSILLFFKLVGAFASENRLVVSGSAKILRDDHAQAKAKAIAHAKRNLMLQLLGDFLPNDLLLPFRNRSFIPNEDTQKEQQLIQTHVLKNPDRFIGELSLIQENVSKDFTRVDVQLRATVFQGHLISVLESLELPVQFAGGLTPVIVTIRGVSLGEVHQQFIGEVFERDFRWRDWRIDVLTRSNTIYRGEYAGDFSKWLKQIPKQTFSSQIRISQAQYKPPHLDLQLDMLQKVQQLPSAQISKQLEQTLDERGLPQPDLQVVMQRDVLSSLPAETLVYGQIPRRGGSASFQLEGENLERLEFQWFPIGKTRLFPKIWIYDKNWNLIGEKKLKKYSSTSSSQIIEWTHKNPDDALPKYIRIVDATGYIENDAGNLLSLDYLLKWSVKSK